MDHVQRHESHRGTECQVDGLIYVGDCNQFVERASRLASKQHTLAASAASCIFLLIFLSLQYRIRPIIGSILIVINASSPFMCCYCKQNILAELAAPLRDQVPLLPSRSLKSTALFDFSTPRRAFLFPSHF